MTVSKDEVILYDDDVNIKVGKEIVLKSDYN